MISHTYSKHIVHWALIHFNLVTTWFLFKYLKAQPHKELTILTELWASFRVQSTQYLLTLVIIILSDIYNTHNIQHFNLVIPWCPRKYMKTEPYTELKNHWALILTLCLAFTTQISNLRLMPTCNNWCKSSGMWKSTEETCISWRPI